MITATFAGGPLDGQTRALPHDAPPLTLPLSGLAANDKIGTARVSIDLSYVHYVLHFTDKHGVAHYYVPN